MCLLPRIVVLITFGIIAVEANRNSTSESLEILPKGSFVAAGTRHRHSLGSRTIGKAHTDNTLRHWSHVHSEAFDSVYLNTTPRKQSLLDLKEVAKTAGPFPRHDGCLDKWWSWRLVSLAVLSALVRFLLPSYVVGDTDQKCEAARQQGSGSADTAPPMPELHRTPTPLKMGHLKSGHKASSGDRPPASAQTEAWSASTYRLMRKRDLGMILLVIICSAFLGFLVVAVGTWRRSNGNESTKGVAAMAHTLAPEIFHSNNQLTSRAIWFASMTFCAVAFTHMGTFALYGEDCTPRQFRRVFFGWLCAWLIGLGSVFAGVGMFAAFIIMSCMVLVAFGIEAMLSQDAPSRNRWWLLLIVCILAFGLVLFFMVALLYIHCHVPLILSLGMPSVLSLMLIMLQSGTELLVYNPRHCDLDVDEDELAQGDQNLSQSCVIFLIYMWMEAIRFGALIYESLSDDNLYLLVSALTSTLIVETLTRLLLPHWWVILLTTRPGNQEANNTLTTRVVREEGWAKLLHWLTLPTPMLKYLNEVKGTAGFIRLPAILFVWAARSATIGQLDSTDGMKTLIVVAVLVFIEENTEDTLVYILGEYLKGQLSITWSPEWSSLAFFQDLLRDHEPYHPQQVVNNPCMKYRQLPVAPLLGIVAVVFTFQVLILFIIVGQRWVFGCQTEMNPDDMSMFWWPSDSPCEVLSMKEAWAQLCPSVGLC